MVGCTKVHEGCDHCYAETLSKRFGDEIWSNDKPRREIKSVWRDLNKFQKLAEKAGEIHKVFVGSMMDIFEKPMPVISINGESGWINTGELRDKFFTQISENKYPNILFLLLTKRPSNINKYIPENWLHNPPKNIMFGTSPVNQETANKLVSQLLKVNGKRFLSIEPQLDEVDLTDIFGLTNFSYNALSGISDSPVLYSHNSPKIDWVICGGESGGSKRPFNSDWGRSLRDQCKKSATPFFMKQIDKIQEIPNYLLIREFPNIKI